MASISDLRERITVDMVRWAPKGAFSRLVGAASRAPVPRPLREPLFGGFARKVGANLDEIERPLEAYRDFNAFFTRRLRSGARPIDATAEVVSPCDGLLVEHGEIDRGRLIQAKGRDYTLRALLVDHEAAAGFEGGSFATIYLAPRDYHRVHVPVDGVVTGYRHMPGAFFPVNPPSVRNVSGLFAINERLVTYLESERAGPVAVVMVAATGVGNIRACYDAVETHRRPRQRGRVGYATPKPVRRGDELGVFNLGSTVIVLLARGRCALVAREAGVALRMGEPLARAAGADVRAA